jgi:hypothetical protein
MNWKEEDHNLDWPVKMNRKELAKMNWKEVDPNLSLRK